MFWYYAIGQHGEDGSEGCARFDFSADASRRVVEIVRNRRPFVSDIVREPASPVRFHCSRYFRVGPNNDAVNLKE